MPYVISIINYKGGVGKTTLTLNLSFAFSTLFKKKVLMVDLDPQCSLSISVMKEEEWIDHIENRGSIVNIIENFYKGNTKLDEKWLHQTSQSENTFLLPGHLNLPEYEMKLIYQKPLYLSNEEFETQRFFLLQKFIKSINSNFDYIFLDCPPNIYILSRNAILASDFYIIPTIPDFVSSFGIPFIHKHIEELIRNWLVKTKFLGIVLNRVKVQKQTFVREQKLGFQSLQEMFPSKVFSTFIPDRILMSGVMRRKINIFQETAKKYEILQREFHSLTLEIMERIKSYS